MLSVKINASLDRSLTVKPMGKPLEEISMQSDQENNEEETKGS